MSVHILGTGTELRDLVIINSYHILIDNIIFPVNVRELAMCKACTMLRYIIVNLSHLDYSACIFADI